MRNEKAIQNLRAAVKNGDIIHVENTGEEFLRYKIEGEYDYRYSYLGVGDITDWKDLEGVELELDGEYPDPVGGLITSNLYVQPNQEVLNPLDEFEGWEDEWEIIDENRFRHKRPY